MPQLKHLDLQPISHEERAPFLPIALGVNLCNTASNLLEVNRKEEENIRNDYQDKILNKGKPVPSSLNPGAIDLPSNSRIVTLNGWGATDRSTNSAENPLWQSTYSRPEASNGIAVHALTPASPPTYSSALESYSSGVNHSEITTCPSTDSIVRQRGSTEQNNGSDTRVGSDSYNRSSSVISSLLSVRNATGQQSNIDHPLNQTRSSTSTKTRGVGESTIGSKAVISECPDGAQGDKMRARAIFVEGEEWEWPYSLTDSTSLAGLRGVSVMSINHMSATGIRSIISENLVYLPSLSVLKLSDNNITTLTQVFRTDILMMRLEVHTELRFSMTQKAM